MAPSFSNLQGRTSRGRERRKAEGGGERGIRPGGSTGKWGSRQENPQKRKRSQKQEIKSMWTEAQRREGLLAREDP